MRMAKKETNYGKCIDEGHDYLCAQVTTHTYRDGDKGYELLWRCKNCGYEIISYANRAEKKAVRILGLAK